MGESEMESLIFQLSLVALSLAQHPSPKGDSFWLPALDRFSIVCIVCVCIA